MASVLKSAGEFRRRVVVKSRMRRRFKIRQEIGANNFLDEGAFSAPFRGVDAGQPTQDVKDSSRSRPFHFDAADRKKEPVRQPPQPHSASKSISDRSKNQLWQ